MTQPPAYLEQSSPLPRQNADRGLKRFFLPDILLIVLLSTIVWGCSPKQSSAPANPARLPNVPSVVVQPQIMEPTTTVSARVRAAQSADIRAQVRGVLSRIVVNEGDFVRKGQLLLEISAPEINAQYQSASAGLAKASAEAEFARESWNRYRALPEGAISAQDLAAWQLRHAQAQAEVERLTAERERLANDLSHTRVTAPIDGVIGRIEPTLGSLVGSGEATLITTLTDTSRLWIDFSLPAQMATPLRSLLKKMPVAVTILGDTGASLPSSATGAFPQGQLVVIENRLDETIGAISARAVVDNKSAEPLPELMVGARVNVQVPIGAKQSALVLPARALINANNQVAVFVLVANDSPSASPSLSATNTPIVYKVQQRLVTVGGETGRGGSLAIITQGLKAGDRVVIGGHNRIRSGMEVTSSEDKVL